MRRRPLRAAAIGAAALAVVAVTGAPGEAAGVAESGPRANPPATRDGLDYDAACVAGSMAPPPAANHFRSDGGLSTATGAGNGTADFPGCPDQAGHIGSSLYDGSAEAADLSTVDLTSFVDGFGDVWLKATIHVDGSIPAAGTTTQSQALLDTPNQAQFPGVDLVVAFQNKDKQHNGDNPNSGCTSVDTGTHIRDESGHWRDGWHYFLGFRVVYEADALGGGRYVHDVYGGVYNPRPNGGFVAHDFGRNSGSPVPAHRYNHLAADEVDHKHRPSEDWRYQVDTSPTGPSKITIQTVGRVWSTNPACLYERYVKDYGSDTPGRYANGTYTGDRLHNIKGLSLYGVSARGGFPRVSDTTAGNSTSGVVAGDPTSRPVNVAGIAYTLGGEGGTDTTGPTQTCPTPNPDSTGPDNPIWAAQEVGSANGVGPCEMDDDIVGRGSRWIEMWETAANYNIP